MVPLCRSRTIRFCVRVGEGKAVAAERNESPRLTLRPCSDRAAASPQGAFRCARWGSLPGESSATVARAHRDFSTAGEKQPTGLPIATLPATQNTVLASVVTLNGRDLGQRSIRLHAESVQNIEMRFGVAERVSVSLVAHESLTASATPETGFLDARSAEPRVATFKIVRRFHCCTAASTAVIQETDIGPYSAAANRLQHMDTAEPLFWR